MAKRWRDDAAFRRSFLDLDAIPEVAAAPDLDPFSLEEGGKGDLPEEEGSGPGRTGESHGPKPAGGATGEGPLPALSVFKTGSLSEARECVRLLDLELAKNPGNERAKTAKLNIMEVFRAETGLGSAKKRAQEGRKEYETKVRNLQIASRPNRLTRRIDYDEIYRIRREISVVSTQIQQADQSVTTARAELKRLLQSASTAIPEPDKEPLARLWQVVSKRNNL